MANSTADGSVVIDVNMDVSQAEKRLGKLRDNIKKTEKEIADATTARDEAQKKLDNSPLEQEQKKLQDMMAARKKAAEVESSLVPISKEISDLEAKLSEQQQNRLRTEENIKKTKDAIISAEKELSILESSPKNNERYKKRVEELNEFLRVARPAVGNMGTNLDLYNREIQNAVASLDQLKERADKISLGNPETVASNEEVKSQEEKIKTIQDEWKATQKDVERYTAQIEKANEKLGEQKTEAGILTQEIDRASKSQGLFEKSADESGKAMTRFNRRIVELVKSAFIFNVISAGLRSIQQITMKYIKTNDEARQAIAQLKGALLALAQPLIEVLIPVFTLLVNILTKIVTAVAQFVSMLFGKTLKQSKDGAKALHQEASAIGAVGEAADEAAGSLAGFDEINTISAENAKGSSGGDGIGTGGEIAPDFSGLIGGELYKITAIVASALLALGAILAFSGANIPLGLALMAIGAISLASAIYENWGVIAEKLRGPIGLITVLVSAALLALGALLLFSGVNIPLGLALIAAGALGLAAVVAANWESLSEVLSGPIGVITSAISAALLALGALLAFSGVNIPLGLALMAAGAVGLVASIASNWDSVQQALEGPTGTVTGMISGLLLALGAILLFSGADIPLGLGLLTAGAIGLVSSISANWETVQTALQGPVGTITAFVSGALLALGAILAFSGAALPLGIGLMAAGAVGLVTTITANWNTVQNALNGPIGAVTAIVSAALLVLGIILLFTGAGIPLGLGLIAAGAVGLAATVAPNWDFVLDAVKGAWTNVKNWWNENAAKFFTLDYWKDLGKGMIDGLLKGLAGIFTGLASWASNVWNTITGAFSDKNAKASVSRAGAAAGASAATGKSNVRIADIPSIAPQNIPRLAQGAVIPPNREFMAVLGDQRNGTNLEAPENLIRKIVREEAGGGDGQVVMLLQALLEAVKAGQVIMVDKAVLGRTARDGINDITTKSGKFALLF